MRRYFESSLCYETLKDTLDKLDYRMLDRHFGSIFIRIPVEKRFKYLRNIMSGTHEGSSRCDGMEKEYAEAIRLLKDSKTFQSLKPKKDIDGKTPEQILRERKNKMALLAMCSLAAVHTGDPSLPLDFYYRKGYVYDPLHRGRTDRQNEEGQKNQHVRH